LLRILLKLALSMVLRRAIAVVLNMGWDKVRVAVLVNKDQITKSAMFKHSALLVPKRTRNQIYNLLQGQFEKFVRDNLTILIPLISNIVSSNKSC
jgi:uncharacterized protein (DUF1786 family)